MAAKQYSHEQLNAVLQDLDGNYKIISQVSYLPKRSSKAIHRDYLHQVLTDDNVWLPPHNTPRYTYSYRGHGNDILLETLEKEVKKKGKSLFMSVERMPDINWVKDSLIFLFDGVDKLDFLGRIPKDFRLTPQERLEFKCCKRSQNPKQVI